MYKLLRCTFKEKKGGKSMQCVKYISAKYEIGCAIVSNVLLEHSCRTEMRFHLILAVKKLLTYLKSNLLHQVNQKNAEIGAKKMQSLSK